jgi:hypothetical protein
VQDDSLAVWCVNRILVDGQQKDLRAIILLGLWKLWKHRNAIVFEGASPSVELVGLKILSEAKAWEQAGIIKGDVEQFFSVGYVG